MTKLPNDADRYTVLLVPLDEFPEKMRAASELGLEWFARPIGRFGINRIEMHLFFDSAGAHNYLVGLYDDYDERDEEAKE